MALFYKNKVKQASEPRQERKCSGWLTADTRRGPGGALGFGMIKVFRTVSKEGVGNGQPRHKRKGKGRACRQGMGDRSVSQGNQAVLRAGEGTGEEGQEGVQPHLFINKGIPKA